MISPANPSGLWQQLLQQLLYADVLTKGSDILILLAATVLVYRTFRERYLLPWMGGWAAYLVYRLFASMPAIRQYPEIMLLSQVAYVVGATCFALAVLQYTRRQQWQLTIFFFCLLAICAGALRGIWGDHLYFTVPELLFALSITWIAAAQLIVYSRGRREFGAWLMVPMLCLLHLDFSHVHEYSGLDIAIELLLGLSMLIIVLDRSQQQTERLKVVNAITRAIARADKPGPLVLSALDELKRHTGASSAWYRVLQEDKLVLEQQIGVPLEFARRRGTIRVDDSLAAAMVNTGKPGFFEVTSLPAPAAAAFEGLDVVQVVVVPVRGKSSVTGTISLGLARYRSYLQEEFRFLSSVGDQLGMALESLQMFEQVLRSQRQWISTFDSIDDMILVHDEQNRVMRINRALLQRLGKRIHEVIHEPVASVLPNVRPEVHCPYCHDPVERYMEGADPCFGGHSLVSTSSYSEAGSSGQGTIHIVKDTTERRAAEERYRLMFEEVGEGVYITTSDGRILDMNDAFVRMLGYDNRQELLNADLGRTVYVRPEDCETIREEIREKNFVRNFETTLLRKDGGTVTVLESSFGTRDANGKIVRYQGFLVDITEQKRVETEIKRRNRELNALNAIAVIGAQSFDLDEILNVTLRQVAELFGAEMGSVWVLQPETLTLRARAAFGGISLGIKLPEFTLPPELYQAIVEGRPEFLTAEHMALLPVEVQNYLRELGIQSWIWVLLWVSGKPSGVLAISNRFAREYSTLDRNLMVAIARQLATTVDKVRLYEETTRAYDDLRRTQEQLLQSEKMSAVGQLISGVAHELNNPLTAIVGYAQLLEQEPLSARALDFVQKLYKQTQRTRRVVQNLLSFARQRKPLKQDVDLRRVVDETLALRDYDLKLNNIEVEREFSDDFPHVIADAHQLEQVFLNIINNAVDAMLEGRPGGKLRVCARADHERNVAVIEFQDSGPGIKEPNRIFDPFYTTKVVGKGTGLGLSICYGIVKEHGGDITAFNHPEGGAVFRISLPLAARRAATEVAPVSVTNEPLLGKILAIDDEEAVLEMEQELLGGAGAEVICARDGVEAIRCLQSHVFDAIVLDSKMPGEMDAPEVYRWVQQNQPEMAARLVFTISHATEGRVRDFLEEHAITHIEKPFQVSELIALVRRIIAAHKAAAMRGAS